MLTSVFERTNLAVKAADAKPTGHQDSVHVAQVLFGILIGGAQICRHPVNLDLHIIGEAASAQGLRDGKIGIGQVNIFANERDLHISIRVVHGA